MDPSDQGSCLRCGRAFGTSPSYLFIGERTCGECFRAVREEASRRAREREEARDTPPAEPGTEDKALHCTAAAAVRLNRDAVVYRAGHMTPAQIAPLLWTRGPDGEISVDYDWRDISRFAGSKGWRFSTDGAGHGPMFFHRAKAGENRYLGVYTSIGTMLRMFPDEACPHAAVITTGDLKDLILRDPSLTGIILDPNTEYHCMIPRTYIR